MSISNPKYKYLAAWDNMMHSGFSWRLRMQQEAEQDNAPLDVVYETVDGVWVRFSEVESKKTRDRIQSMVDAMN